MVKVRGDTMKKNEKKKTKKKYGNKIIYVFVAILVFIIVLLALTFKGTRSTDTSEGVLDTISIDCQEKAAKDSEVECAVSVNSTSILAKGLTMKYNLAEGMEFVSFTVGQCAGMAITEEGAVLLNLGGVSGEWLVGTLKLKMPADAEPDSVYNVELVEASIGDGEDTVVELENASDEIRVLSEVNTLESIVLVNGKINETFDKSVNNYTAEVDVDKIMIEVVKTDENSVVTGDSGIELNLQYGTNTFEVVVTSEDGTANVYTLKVFRNYEFTTDKYLYNKEENYIYVGTDLDNLLNNIKISDELFKEIKDNKLVISDEDEKLLEIDILYVLFGDCEVSDKTLYLYENMNGQEFIQSVEHSYGLVLNFSRNVIDVYYDGEEIDSYILIVYREIFDSSLTIDEDNKYIKNLTVGTLVSDFISKITVNGGVVHVYDNAGNVKENDDLIATGDEVIIYTTAGKTMNEYRLSVLGDSNGDGKMSLTDLAQFRKHLVNWVNPTTGVEFKLAGVYSEAFDLNGDGKISILDLAIMRKKIVGLI